MAPDTGRPGASGLDALVADLRALGAAAALATDADIDRVTDRVLRALPEAPARGPSVARRAAATAGVALGAALARRRRRVAVALVVVLLALTGIPAVRAAVADWFGFAGVRVRLEPGAPPPSATPSPPPGVVSRVPLAEAASLVSFPVLVPSALGEPDGVEVSGDRRVLSMSWTVPGAGVVRLDEFDGELDYVFAKTASDVDYTSVGGDFALWFDRPHAVAWLAGPGTSRTEPPRLAGHTLIWQQDGTALRLEGDLPLERAREIAESVRSP